MSNNSKAPITAVVITKNEARAIERCLASLDFCDQVLVVDSGSTDATKSLAYANGAEVLEFNWDGHYPKKKQWGMQHTSVKHNWVLHIDGDEIVSAGLANELRNVTAEPHEHVAFDVRLSYHFMGKRLRFGHRVHKRSLVDRRFCDFPEVGDLNAPGIGEVEGHYQPVCRGRVGVLNAQLIHDDPDPLSDWVGRHNRYSDWEAFLYHNPGVRRAVHGSRSPAGRLFDRVPIKPVAFFIYGYIFRLGFLDGRAGLDYSISLAWYYWITALKSRDAKRFSSDDGTNPLSTP